MYVLVYAQASQYVECYTCSGVDTDANNPCPEIGFDPVKLNATIVQCASPGAACVKSKEKLTRPGKCCHTFIGKIKPFGKN